MKMVTTELRRRPEFGPSRQFDQGSDYHWLRSNVMGPICDALDIQWDNRAWDLIVLTKEPYIPRGFMAGDTLK